MDGEKQLAVGIIIVFTLGLASLFVMILQLVRRDGVTKTISRPPQKSTKLPAAKNTIILANAPVDPTRKRPIGAPTRVSVNVHDKDLSDLELLAKIQSLTSTDFKLYILKLFTHLDYEASLAAQDGEASFDISLKKNSTESYVQCRQYATRQVGVNQLKSFCDACLDNLNTGELYFVTTSMFTKEAHEYKKEPKRHERIKLIDSKRLIELVRTLELMGKYIPIPKSKSN